MWIKEPLTRLKTHDVWPFERDQLRYPIRLADHPPPVARWASIAEHFTWADIVHRCASGGKTPSCGEPKLPLGVGLLGVTETGPYETVVGQPT